MGWIKYVRRLKFCPKAAPHSGSPSFWPPLPKRTEEPRESQEGLNTAVQGLELVQQSGERCWEAELYRVRGELLLKRDPSHPAEARAALESAVEVARKQGAKSLELRATT